MLSWLGIVKNFFPLLSLSLTLLSNPPLRSSLLPAHTLPHFFSPPYTKLPLCAWAARANALNLTEGEDETDG